MLRLLKCALALDKHRNFARAAECLALSQPTLTRNIQDLERQLGVMLFDRNRRGVEPTPFGALVLGAAREIAEKISDLDREIALMKGLDVGELTIGVGPLVAQTWLPGAVSELLAKHPKLKLRIVANEWWELASALRERRIDLGIGELEAVEDDPDIAVEPLPNRPVRFMCRTGHPLTRMKNLTVLEIGHYVLVAPRLPKRVNEYLAGSLRMGQIAENGEYFEPQIECQNIDACLRIVKTSDAISISPISNVVPFKGRDGVVPVRFAEPWMRTGYGILRLRGRTLAPAALAFSEQLIAAEREYYDVPHTKLEGSKVKRRV